MTNGGTTGSGPHLRDDLGAVAVDGDIVVYDPTSETSHILSGGAVALWIALEDDDGRDVVERVAELVGADPMVIDAEVRQALQSFEDRGFLHTADTGHDTDAADTTDATDGAA